MPEIFLTTSYGWIVSDLQDVVTDLEKIATETTETITQVEAELCHHHLDKILKILILSTRLARRRPSLELGVCGTRQMCTGTGRNRTACKVSDGLVSLLVSADAYHASPC